MLRETSVKPPRDLRASCCHTVSELRLGRDPVRRKQVQIEHVKRLIAVRNRGFYSDAISHYDGAGALPSALNTAPRRISETVPRLRTPHRKPLGCNHIWRSRGARSRSQRSRPAHYESDPNTLHPSCVARLLTPNVSQLHALSALPRSTTPPDPGSAPRDRRQPRSPGRFRDWTLTSCHWRSPPMAAWEGC